MKRIVLLLLAALLAACQTPDTKISSPGGGKVVVYQVFTRLFGNTQTTYKPWGTPEENGVGKMNDFTDKALQEIRALGVTHIWYTGIPHHATVTDYSSFGITPDDPDVVKGRAGSPYAVKDYYSVDPDLAVDPARRLEEFRSLVERSHRAGMKVIIDIVPNHVARRYESIAKPAGVAGFGENDDTTVEYARDNDFYYIPGKPFEVPEPQNGYQPLGGEAHPLADGYFGETPAKWTGNGSREPQPSHWDWYETVKINFGVRPDGSKDFDLLPEGYDQKPVEAHFAYWQDKDVPASWVKFRDIALFWLDQGVDGFRFDMAEMVPVEFWSFMNSSIKHKNPEAFLLAEVYNPTLYRDYIHKGKMDYLYDKVELYDTLKHIIQGHGSTDHLAAVQAGLADIEHHMLHFLENHDEQRIASPGFAGDPRKALPAMVLSATISTSPTMIYFGQEVGEPGAEEPGFGDPSRTSIFDYIGVPHHQRWMNGGAFDGGALLPEEAALREYYKKLLNFTLASPALLGEYREIHTFNRERTPSYGDKLFSFVRWAEGEKLIIVCNFDATAGQSVELQLPQEITNAWGVKERTLTMKDQLSEETVPLKVTGTGASLQLTLQPLQSLILRMDDK
ncbi:MAG TPA: alpha-amylase family glycosyl hydrolase [Prolixibacteraceae bacterium]|nr:alpha-amylase family glycosyl hydrolase [Prolixibacteraceae bacterium]HOG95861.1 alpha-amylase family glycosyl hydrolase [Prolixibacteraceae bacterium]HQB68452.1 alpha-amylase family glycosyl hydrolase [Prolixibacteraceae bacterium]HQL18834.1 alpha-amylase family glycosyl hydrolase [Prolixibacteraceae bacterium]